MSNSVPPQYFIDLYRRESDPWNFAVSAYEREKYRATLDALPKARYANALEIACSIGVFTSMLAERSDNLVAIDVSPEVVERARFRCRRLPNVRFETRAHGFSAPTYRLDVLERRSDA